MATGAVLNACWDLAARRAGKPLWLLLAELTPEEITALVDFRYLSDALTPDEALGLLERGAARPGRADRGAAAATATRPTRPRPAGSATPTSGWRRCAPRRSTRASPRSSSRSARRSTMTSAGSRSRGRWSGDDVGIAIDANQVWDVPDRHRLDQGAGAVPARVDRGAHRPGGRPGHRGDPPRGAPGQGRHRRARLQPGDVQAAPAGRRRSTSCRSTRAASPG